MRVNKYGSSLRLKSPKGSQKFVKTKWKICIGILVLILIAGGVYASVKYQKRGVVTVQTGKVVREDLASVVTASGEIKPKNYINIGAESSGDLTAILVKEGDHVQKGQLLARHREHPVGGRCGGAEGHA